MYPVYKTKINFLPINLNVISAQCVGNILKPRFDVVVFLAAAVDFDDDNDTILKLMGPTSVFKKYKEI
jgi:hypothetical protein